MTAKEELTPKEEAQWYIMRAREMREDDENYRRDNPTETPEEYALDQIDLDIALARRTGQDAWRRHLERARRWIEKAMKERKD